MVQTVTSYSRARLALKTNVLRSACLWMVILLIGGCANHAETNKALIEFAKQREQGFQAAMIKAAATKETTDDVAIALAYGMTPAPTLHRAETALDWAKVAIPIVGMVLPYTVDWWGSGSSPSMSAGRDIYMQSSRETTGAYDAFLNGQSGLTFPASDPIIVEPFILE